MSEDKTPISNAHTYEEIGEFWDTHDLGDYWDQTYPVEFTIDIQSNTFFYRLDSELVSEVSEVARKRGVSPETLLNLWVQEKLREQLA